MLDKINIKNVKKISFISLVYILVIPIILNIIYLITKQKVDYSWYESIIIVGILNIILYIIYFKLQNKKISFKKHFPFIIWFIFMIWCLISTLISNNKLDAFLGDTYLKNGYLSYIAYSGFMLAGMIINDKKILKKFCKIFVVTSIILSVLSFIDPNTLFFSERMSKIDFSGIFYNSNHYGYYLIIGVVMSMILFIYEKKLLYLIGYIITLFTLIFNNTLGCYIALLGTLILVIIYILITKKNIISTMIVTVIFIMMSLFVTKGSTNLVKQNLNGLFKYSSQIIESIKDDSIDASKAGTNRWGLWTSTLKIIKNRPIFGYGMNNLGEGFDEVGIYPESTNPHNQIIRLMGENGIISAILFLLFHGYLIIKLLLNYKGLNSFNLVFTFIIICFFASSLFGVAAYYTEVYYYMCLGILVNMVMSLKCKEKV